jgi:glycerophosphoryl diester phosphodiesterase
MNYKTLSGNRPLVWAHRGASGYLPENTMEAFEKAIEMNADGIEIDVHFSLDGQIVICHDDKIDRVSNGQGSVTEYTVNELKNFDFGCKFYNGERKGIKIPTLDELYSLYKTCDLSINIEIKTSNADMPLALVEKAKEFGMSERIVYSSFNHLQLKRVLDVDKSAKVAPLYSASWLNMEKYAEEMGAFAIHPIYDQIRVFPDLVERCHSKGICVNPWTLNSEEAIKDMMSAGCDAIITNYPDKVINLLK